jgi:hypothetical protein
MTHTLHLHYHPNASRFQTANIITDCRDVFSAQQSINVTGTWMWPLDECKCFSHEERMIGRCPRSQPRVVPPWPLASVCGGDGVTYDSADDACARGTFPLHGGFCGACSNRHDIDIYNATRNNLTATTTACALELLYHGCMLLIHHLCRTSQPVASQVRRRHALHGSPCGPVALMLRLLG